MEWFIITKINEPRLGFSYWRNNPGDVNTPVFVNIDTTVPRVYSSRDLAEATMDDLPTYTCQIVTVEVKL